MRRTALFIALLAACSPTSFEDIEFTGTMTVTPLQATVGDTITVVLEAEGPRLLSFHVDYGDESNPDFRSVAGSQTARSTTTHVYTEPGTFEIIGRIDELADTIVRMASVTIAADVSAARVPSIFAVLR